MCVLAFSYAPGVAAGGHAALGDGHTPNPTPQGAGGLNAQRPRLHLISNRDEFFTRPTAPAHWWPDADHAARGWVLGGRDLRAGGSWLAINRAGRVAVLTNHRSGSPTSGEMRSRGELVESWLGLRHAAVAAEALAQRMAREAGEFAGFNLLLFDFGKHAAPGSAWILSNRSHEVLAPLTPGVHGLSNEVLNSPWPKSERLKQAIGAEWPSGVGGPPGSALSAPAEEKNLLAALCNEQQAADDELPVTGIPLERERYLSPVFIRPSDTSDPLAYGTRSSSMLRVFGQHAELLEHTWHPQPGARRFQFRFGTI